MKRGTKHEQKQ